MTIKKSLKLDKISVNKTNQEYKMKRLSLFLAISFVLLSFGSANAIYFNGVLDASTFTEPVVGGDFYPGNTPVILGLEMANDDGVDWCGYSMALELSGTGIITDVTYNDIGGLAIGSPEASLNITGNFQSVLYGGTIFMGKSDLYVWGWGDGFPDTCNHTTIGCMMGDGWLLDMVDTTVRIEFGFTVNISGDAVDGDTGSVCLSQINIPYDGGTYDWLFAPAQTMDNAPYCFPFARVPNLPPEITGEPIQLTTQHHVAFDVTYDIVDPEGDDIIAVGASIGTPTLIGGTGGTGQINWVYDPPCDSVGKSMNVTMWADDAMHTGVVTADVDLVVQNTAPVIAGDCGATIIVGTNMDGYANFTATDANSGDTETWYITKVVPTPVSTAYDIVGGTLHFVPVTADDAQSFVFTVAVEDCAFDMDSCDVQFDVVSALAFEVKIEKDEGDQGYPGAFQGHHAMVDITLEDGTEEMHGFDFLIAYDAGALAFTGAYGGELFDMTGAYQWEYFEYRFGDHGNCYGGCPSGLLRVVAIADQNDGLHHPLQLILPVPGFVLFSLDFLVTNDRTFECMFVPISFFWMDCGDNTIAFRKSTDDPLDIKLAISKGVYGFFGWDGVNYIYNEITDFQIGVPAVDAFPTYFGAPELCLSENPEKTPERFINFYNGGIDIICGDSIDAKGDVNLNGVAYEIADAVVLTNYFIYGLTAFQINVEGQIAASDANNDGIPLSVADLVYLIRVIVGDELPYAKLSPNAVTAQFGQAEGVISTDVELGAVLFVLEGDANVSLADGAAGMELKSAYVDGFTRVLIYTFENGRTCSGNVLNTDGNIVSVEASDYFGNSCLTKALPTTFSVSNYPNPFNPTTVIELALPQAADWSVTIYNVAGQVVETMNGSAEAGIVPVVWDASDQASGIYFYKAKAGDNTATKKMVLLK